MGYRKFAADNIFNGFEMTGPGKVLVTDGAGGIVDLINKEDAGEELETFDGILSPGLVNCHCHLELSHMKGMVPAGTGMVKFLLAVLGNRSANAERIGQAIADAEDEMIANGIVAVGDICNTPDTLAQKQKGRLTYHNFIETIGVSEAAAHARFQQSAELMSLYPGRRSVAPHAPYSVSAKLMSLIDQSDPQSLLTIHNQESHAENELFEKGTGDFLELYQAIGAEVSEVAPTGVSSLRSYLGRFSPTHQMLLVHNTVTNDDDIDWMKLNEAFLPRIYWCLCPNANLYINHLLADIHVLSRSRFKIVVGTDSLASNRQLDIIAELGALQQHFPQLTTAELLRWATINGAEALGMGDRYGNFGKGKTPGIVLIENSDNRFTGHSRARRIL